MTKHERSKHSEWTGGCRGDMVIPRVLNLELDEDSKFELPKE